MAFDSSNLTRIAGGNGFGLYTYDSTDTIATTIIAGYMNNTDDDQNLAKGDIIILRQWGTAVRSGTVADVGIVTVMNVSSGSVDLSNDLLAATVTYT
jgi:hypothetical protein